MLVLQEAKGAGDGEHAERRASESESAVHQAALQRSPPRVTASAPPSAPAAALQSSYVQQSSPADQPQDEATLRQLQQDCAEMWSQIAEEADSDNDQDSLHAVGHARSNISSQEHPPYPECPEDSSEEQASDDFLGAVLEDGREADRATDGDEELDRQHSPVADVDTQLRRTWCVLCFSREALSASSGAGFIRQ